MSSEHHRLLRVDELPCFAFHHRDRSTALLSLSGRKLVDAGDADEFLLNKVICPTAQGFLLVRDSDDNHATILWNPSDGDKVLLPPLEGVEDTVLMDSNCLLSNKPSAPGCTVMLVECSTQTLIWYCRPGDVSWTRYEYDIGTQVLPYPGGEDEHEKIVICPVAACDGKFYFNGTTTELGVMDFGGGGAFEPVVSTITVDDTVAADGSYGYDESRPGLIFLVESDGELFMVRLLHALVAFLDDGPTVIDTATVHRMDFGLRRWQNVRDLGGRSFLLSRFYFGASCRDSGGERGRLRPDCVYFACPRSNSLQVFHVKEGTHELHKLEEAPVVDSAFWLFSADP